MQLKQMVSNYPNVLGMLHVWDVHDSALVAGFSCSARGEVVAEYVKVPQPLCSYSGKLQRTAGAAHSRQEIVSILDDMFPPTTSAAKGKLLREAFAAVCPREPWKVGCLNRKFVCMLESSSVCE